MKFLSLLMVSALASLAIGRAEILLSSGTGGTAIAAELIPGASVEISLRVGLSEGAEPVQPELQDKGSPAMEGARVEVKRVLRFPSGEELRLERFAEAGGNTVEFREEWEGALAKASLSLGAFLPSEDFTDGKVVFLGANGEEVTPPVSLAHDSTGAVRGLKCRQLQLLGWRGRNLTFEFGTAVDCYLYFRKSESGREALDLRILLQRAGISSSEFRWSLAVSEQP